MSGVVAFYAFRQDGTFSFRNITGIDSGARTSSQQTQFAGNYTLRDNALTLFVGGHSEQHMVFPVAGGNLNIDGMVYQKR